MARSPVVYCAGEALWDLHASRGTPLGRARSLRLDPGGAAVLVAMRLARANIAVGLAAAVGDDPLGRALRDRVGAAGVDVRAVALVPRRTPLLFVGSGAGTYRELVGYREPEREVVVALPRGARPKLVHIAALSPVPAHARALDAIAKGAIAHGAIVTVDVNARPRLWRTTSAQARIAAVGMADLVKASADDLEVLGLGKGLRAIAGLRVRMRPDATLLVTRGAGPITAHGPFGTVERSVRPIRDVDPTGAGDAFTAGVLASLVKAPPRGLADPAWIEAALSRGESFARARLQKQRR